MPAHRAPHQEPAPYWIRGTLRLRGRTGRAVGQQPRRAQAAPCGYQPQDQRGHPVGTWYRAQDDAGIHLRHLARTRPEPPRRLPPTAHFPSNLNSYAPPYSIVIEPLEVVRVRLASPLPMIPSSRFLPGISLTVISLAMLIPPLLVAAFTRTLGDSPASTALMLPLEVLNRFSVF